MSDDYAGLDTPAVHRHLARCLAEKTSGLGACALCGWSDAHWCESTTPKAGVVTPGTGWEVRARSMLSRPSEWGPWSAEPIEVVGGDLVEARPA